MRRLTAPVAVGFLGLSWLAPAMPARAGIYTDDLSRCLIESSTKQDKNVLVQWVFVALSQHPAIAYLSKTSAADIEKSNAAAAELFTRLLADTCAEKTRQAIKYEGMAAIQSAFGVFGQVASEDLFTDAKVQAVMSGLEKHIDKKKLESLSGTPPATEAPAQGPAPGPAPGIKP